MQKDSMSGQLLTVDVMWGLVSLAYILAISTYSLTLHIGVLGVTGLPSEITNLPYSFPMLICLLISRSKSSLVPFWSILMESMFPKMQHLPETILLTHSILILRFFLLSSSEIASVPVSTKKFKSVSDVAAEVVYAL